MTKIPQSQVEFYELAENLLAEYFAGEPIWATAMGIHDYDDQLGHYDSETLFQKNQQIKQYLEIFSNIDNNILDLDAKIDLKVVTGLLNRFILEYEEIRHWEKNPSYAEYPIYGIHLLLTKPTAPLNEMLPNIISRLKQTRRVLEEGKTNVTRPVKVFTETALQMTHGGIAFFENILPPLGEQVPELKEELLMAKEDAVNALKEYANWLETEALPNATDEFAIGEKAFNTLLQEDHLLNYTADTLIAKGWELFNETETEMNKVANEISPGHTWQEVVEQLKEEHPSKENLVSTYKEWMNKSRQFTIEKNVADIPEGETLEVQETPDFLKPIIPYAAYMPPETFSKDMQGTFWVSTPMASLPEEQQEAMLKDHIIYKIPITAIHEAYPGHHLQLTTAKVYNTSIRKLAHSTLLAEGWAFYTEELAEQLGFLDNPKMKLIRLKDQLWRAARIILDGNLHTGKMTIEEAVSFMVEKVLLDKGNALAEVRRYAATPTQPMSYLIGKLEIMQIAEEYKNRKGQDFNLKTFHNELLAVGSVPPALAREKLFS